MPRDFLRGFTQTPQKVLEIANGDAVEPVWRNELGGLTFRLQGSGSTRFVKWQPHSGVHPARRQDVDLTAEAEKLSWAGHFIRVPRVEDQGENDDAAWLVTEGIDGESAHARRWRADPETAVVAIAAGLRQLHDTVPVKYCPYIGTWLASKLDRAPEPDHLVVCHGDPCVPNTLIAEDGCFAGLVDLAQLGVADRWADLAIATYSISWDINFGRSYDELFFEAYGLEADTERIRAYRRLWDEPD
ncbi:aminoglycoside 3'-phosphotransferase [Nesterenkonia salmonea]|uniref:Aminoglycoside 3'-phosphotransferase n=1 Tax=Nesterenkonia salmonea TaxID=1804987 RepID=A0A5R9BB26_9MICC|nr:aminoglycoside 3'-phosphotransferase [Nesterenkonia salmonea]TLP97430.1 aminoglycoside 3'-phosphotransferase [Nesterenkonia salmonea]